MALSRLAWRSPYEVLSSFAEEPFALGLLSDGGTQGRWSYLGWRPSATFSSLGELRDTLNASPLAAPCDPDHPPFQGGAAGLACYEWGAALDPAMPQGGNGWPVLAGGLYDRLLAFDHWNRCVWAIGRTQAGLEDARDRLGARDIQADAVSPIALNERGSTQAHIQAVAAVRDAILSGDLFQANIARAWEGRLPRGMCPVEVLGRLIETSPAPFAGYLRLPGRAVVSNSPERFLRVDAAGSVQTQPIKGTRPRGRTPAEDQALAQALLASAKDRAENLMIVDLMRNDLARACRPGTVKVGAFCALESFANVHHLVSTIVGRLTPNADAIGLFAAAFPPGSITGAPKIQAMIEIARHEPPRGPYCGSLFWAGGDGAFDSSVLIRTLAFEQDAQGWGFEARAGGGITADSVPEEEGREAVAKIAAIRAALAAQAAAEPALAL